METMMFRIMATDKTSGEAYAERIKSYRLLAGDRVYVEALNGTCYFASSDDIIINPEIVRKCSAEWLYKIKVR